LVKGNFIETKPDVNVNKETDHSKFDFNQCNFINIENEYSKATHSDFGYIYFYSEDCITNGYDMGITLNPIPWYDGVNVIFGYVCKGREVLQNLNQRLLSGNIEKFRS